MARYIFRFSGSDPAPAASAEEALRSAGLQVVDSSTNMYLVEGEKADVDQAARKLPGWTHHPERTYSIPDPRQKLRKS